MRNRLDYNKKCYILFIGFGVFVLLGYKLSFADTFIIAAEIEEKEKKLKWLKEKETELPILKLKMTEFEKIYLKNDSTSVRDKLTGFISGFAEKNNSIVTEIPTSLTYINDNVKIQTNCFTVKGNFHNLIKLLYYLENEQKYLAKVMSSKFFSLNDYKTKKRNLYLSIITQSFEHK